MRGDSLVNLVLEYPEDRPPSEWDESTYVEDIKALFAEWDPKYNFPIHTTASQTTTNENNSLCQLLALIKSALKWPLRFSVPLEHWCSKSGRFVLLGDAAHVVPSFLAQGWCTLLLK
jgi:salicylate hydroxylase